MYKLCIIFPVTYTGYQQVANKVIKTFIVDFLNSYHYYARPFKQRATHRQLLLACLILEIRNEKNFSTQQYQA